MADKTKQRASHQSPDSIMEFEDHELEAAMDEFLEEEEKTNTNIWNFATIVGIAMVFVAMVALIQFVGLGIGPDLSELITVMPLIGGILVTLVGFGFLVGDRKREKRDRRKRKKNRRHTFEFEDDETGNFGLDNDLDSRFESRNKAKNHHFESYIFRHSKRLYKSRTDKKLAGVCGGLAKYFGISSTVIRLLFVITFFAGSGASLLAYIALAIALDKEPPELMDDFEY